MWVILAAQAVVFAVWGYWMFKVLFRLRERAVAETGHNFPGPIASVRQFAAFVREAEFARDRQVLGFLTLVLFALTGVFALLASPSGAG